MLNLKALLIKILAQITPIDDTTTSIHFRRVGNMVFVDSNAKITTLANQWNGWFTAGENFRPAAIRYIPCLIGGNANIVALVSINTNGAVNIWSSTAVSNQQIWLSGCYMI